MENLVVVEGMFQFGDWSEDGVCKFSITNTSDKGMVTSFNCEAYGDVAKKLQSQFLSDCRLKVTGSLTRKTWKILGREYEPDVVIIATDVEVIREEKK